MKSIKPVVGLILVFILGATSGSLVTYMVLQARMEAILAGGPHAREEVLITRLSRQLDLDSRQREQVKTIIQETHEDMRKIRQKSRPEIEALLTDSQLRISALLRPEQQEKFKKIVAERKAHRQLHNR
jgi:Spy/CpxP family protein refolding chaperone